MAVSYRRTYSQDNVDLQYKHRDGLGRLSLPSEPFHPDGYLLRPKDARLVPLRVQHSARIVNQTPLAIRIVYWIYSPVSRNHDDYMTGLARLRDVLAWIIVALKFLPGCVAITILMLWPQDYSGATRQDGHYDPVPYREWLYAASARNRYEDEPPSQKSLSSVVVPPWASGSSIPMSALTSKQSETLVDPGFLAYEPGPRHLCFIKDSNVTDEMRYEVLTVKEWMQRTGSDTEPDFIFLSYTRLQFCVMSPDKINKLNLSKEEHVRKSKIAMEDRRNLGFLGCHIARTAGVPAFWIDFECLVPDLAMGETYADMEEVFRICDVVRLSNAMAIIRGPSLSEREGGGPVDLHHRAEWLAQWGSRLWTVPEALLCPGPTVSIYTIGESKPEIMLKRRLAAAAWDDAARMDYLIQHYEGSLRLTPLELVSIALQGLMRRKAGMRLPGDASYCLMGLLRRRPVVNIRDGEFEAFARLSLSNDSDKLLERLLCFLPKSHDSPWYDIQDAWGANLWDIEPHCQVAGLVNNQTVTLDGAVGATIRWNKLAQVGFLKRPSPWRTATKIFIRALPFGLLGTLIWVGIGAAVVVNESSSSTGSLIATGVPLFLLAILAIVPYALLKLYRGKLSSVQPYFFGMRGVPENLGIVEQCIFGINFGRLKWSPHGSRLSRHHSIGRECTALPPTQDKEAEARGLQLFTVVDTFTMTATAFYARRPPSVVLVCGREGGMQRAILCSYEWETQTFCRETVLRMKTIVLQHMARVDRFRFRLNRMEN